MIARENVGETDAPHFVFGARLHLVVAIAQRQLYVHADAAGGIGVRVLVKQRLFALNGAIAVEQIDLRWRSRELPGARDRARS